MMDMLEKLRIVNTYIGYFGVPVNVIGLANRLGVRVYDAPWPDHISGKIQKDSERGGESGFAIFVNQNHPLTRKRFTIAHEIAHFVLHEDQIGDGVFDDGMYRSGLPAKVEYQANQLAADILMPRSVLMENADKPIVQLADMFQVSETAMQVRLQIFA